MRFSVKGEYAIQALLELGLHQGRDPVQTRMISKHQRIPRRFLEQVMGLLRKAGLVDSIRGAQGGYILGKDPGDIRMGDVLEAIERPIPPIGCVSNGSDSCWHETELGICVNKEVWKEAKSSIHDALNSMTLKDLCERKRERDQHKVPMYHI